MAGADDGHTYGFSKHDAEQLANAIGGGDVEFNDRFTKYGKAGDSLEDSRKLAIIKTGSGGIPERMGTTPGSASCDVYELVAGVLTDTTENITVHNIATSAVAANVYGQAKKESWSGKWVIDYEQCVEP